MAASNPETTVSLGETIDGHFTYELRSRPKNANEIFVSQPYSEYSKL